MTDRLVAADPGLSGARPDQRRRPRGGVEAGHRGGATGAARPTVIGGRDRNAGARVGGTGRPRPVDSGAPRAPSPQGRDVQSSGHPWAIASPRARPASTTSAAGPARRDPRVSSPGRDDAAPTRGASVAARGPSPIGSPRMCAHGARKTPPDGHLAPSEPRDRAEISLDGQIAATRDGHATRPTPDLRGGQDRGRASPRGRPAPSLHGPLATRRRRASRRRSITVSGTRAVPSDAAPRSPRSLRRRTCVRGAPVARSSWGRPPGACSSPRSVIGCRPHPRAATAARRVSAGRDPPPGPSVQTPRRTDASSPPRPWVVRPLLLPRAWSDGVAGTPPVPPTTSRAGHRGRSGRELGHNLLRDLRSLGPHLGRLGGDERVGIVPHRGDSVCRGSPRCRRRRRMAPSGGRPDDTAERAGEGIVARRGPADASPRTRRVSAMSTPDLHGPARRAGGRGRRHAGHGTAMRPLAGAMRAAPPQRPGGGARGGRACRDRARADGRAVQNRTPADRVRARAGRPAGRDDRGRRAWRGGLGGRGGRRDPTSVARPPEVRDVVWPCLTPRARHARSGRRPAQPRRADVAAPGDDADRGRPAPGGDRGPGRRASCRPAQRRKPRSARAQGEAWGSRTAHTSVGRHLAPAPPSEPGARGPDRPAMPPATREADPAGAPRRRSDCSPGARR